MFFSIFECPLKTCFNLSYYSAILVLVRPGTCPALRTPEPLPGPIRLDPVKPEAEAGTEAECKGAVPCKADLQCKPGQKCCSGPGKCGLQCIDIGETGLDHKS